MMLSEKWEYNSETKGWDPNNPTEGNGNSKDNVVVPQSWITPETVLANDILVTIPMVQDNTRVYIVLAIVKQVEVKKDSP